MIVPVIITYYNNNCRKVFEDSKKVVLDEA